MNEKFKQVDTEEIELPETLFIRDIETRVFQALALRCLAKIEDIALLDGGLIDNLLGRDYSERIKGITVEQDQKNHSVNVRIEVKIAYGISIPAKAEEIQTKVAQEISDLTGLHVGCVHVIFKSLMTPHVEGSLEIAVQEDKEQIEKESLSEV